MKSIFDRPDREKDAPPYFLPPEAFGEAFGMDENNPLEEVSGVNAWDVATRYHEFKANRNVTDEAMRRLRKLSAEAILDRAREVLGSVVHPVMKQSVPLDELPGSTSSEIDLEETLDNAPLAIFGSHKTPLTSHDVWVEYAVPRRQAIVLSVDTSLSMTGEKLALTAVALAVVLLQFPEDPIGIVAFENEAKILKRPEERISIHQLVERFLDVPAQGYTHLEDGLRSSLKLVREVSGSSKGRPPSAVLLTDGKYTAGRDPAYLATRFPHLVVIKMGKERASLSLCRELAQKGRGALREVGELEALPGVMYGVVKDLLRGRSLA